jgi:predicted esterase
MNTEQQKIVNLYYEHNETLAKEGFITTQFGKLKHVKLATREFYVHIPLKTVPSKILIFLHGSRGNALIHAMYRTSLIRFTDYIVIFAQAKGNQKPPHLHKYYNQISFGKLYFEIRDTVPGFKDDLQFMNDILNYGNTEFNIDNYYLMGHSNGGVFACLMAIYLGDRFKGIISHKGGIGFDPNFYLDFTKCYNVKPLLIFVTAKDDIHYKPTINAKDIFDTEGFETVLIVFDDGGHNYCTDQEETILKLLKSL